MTTLEHQQLKGITLKNLTVTILSTASIVTSVLTTYFGLKADVQAIKSAQETEAKITNLRIGVLESQVSLLQRRVDEIKFSAKTTSPAVNALAVK